MEANKMKAYIADKFKCNLLQRINHYLRHNNTMQDSNTFICNYYEYFFNKNKNKFAQEFGITNEELHQIIQPIREHFCNKNYDNPKPRRMIQSIKCVDKYTKLAQSFFNTRFTDVFINNINKNGNYSFLKDVVDILDKKKLHYTIRSIHNGY